MGHCMQINEFFMYVQIFAYGEVLEGIDSMSCGFLA